MSLNLTFLPFLCTPLFLQKWHLLSIMEVTKACRPDATTTLRFPGSFEPLMLLVILLSYLWCVSPNISSRDQFHIPITFLFITHPHHSPNFDLSTSIPTWKNKKYTLFDLNSLNEFSWILSPSPIPIKCLLPSLLLLIRFRGAFLLPV